MSCLNVRKDEKRSDRKRPTKARQKLLLDAHEALVDKLVASLKDKTPGNVRETIEELGMLGGKKALNAVISALDLKCSSRRTDDLAAQFTALETLLE